MYICMSPECVRPVSRASKIQKGLQIRAIFRCSSADFLRCAFSAHMCVCVYVCIQIRAISQCSSADFLRCAFSVHMCVCVYVCMYVYRFAQFFDAQTPIFFAALFLYICVCVYVCMYVCIYTDSRNFSTLKRRFSSLRFFCTCVCVYVFMYVCVYSYIFAQLFCSNASIHTYIHIYIHTHTQTCTSTFFSYDISIVSFGGGLALNIRALIHTYIHTCTHTDLLLHFFLIQHFHGGFWRGSRPKHIRVFQLLKLKPFHHFLL